jgi:D-glycero-alpha-D-manno-heptose-7-phosphate kinase
VEALRSGDGFKEFGEMLHETWQLKKSITDKISNPGIDDISGSARSAGALGGKLLGAGGGGFLLIFVKPELKPAVRKRLNGLLEVQFKFEHSGSQIILQRDSRMG